MHTTLIRCDGCSKQAYGFGGQHKTVSGMRALLWLRGWVYQESTNQDLCDECAPKQIQKKRKVKK